MNILISSAGRRNQLIECFRHDAATLGIKLRVLAVDSQPSLSSACQVADDAYAVPRCTDLSFIPSLLAICQREKVSLLVPTIDTELQVLSEAAEAFAKIGTRVVISLPEVIEIARNKTKTAQYLSAAGVNTPRTSSLRAYRINPSILRFPLIAKPQYGSSSIGIVLGKDTNDFAMLEEENYLVQELWRGKEYTVNMFFDQLGKLRCTVPHQRIEIRGGEVSKGQTQHVPQLVEAARNMARALPGARGPLCFQAIVTDAGEYAVFEINARFGGGYPLAHRAGARFTKWILEDMIGRHLSANDDWSEGVTMLRYDAAVFLDCLPSTED